MSFDEIIMNFIIELTDAVCESNRGTWLALASLPACMSALGFLFCGFAR